MKAMVEMTSILEEELGVPQLGYRSVVVPKQTCPEV